MYTSAGVTGWYTWFWRPDVSSSSGSYDAGYGSTNSLNTSSTSNNSGYSMDTLYSRPVAGDFILNESNPQMTRETVMITGGDFPAGAVMSRAAATDPYGLCDASHTDLAINYDRVDASAADKNALVIVRLTALKANHLAWPTAFVAADIEAVTTALTAQNLILR